MSVVQRLFGSGVRNRGPARPGLCFTYPPQERDKQTWTDPPPSQPYHSYILEFGGLGRLALKCVLLPDFLRYILPFSIVIRRDNETII